MKLSASHPYWVVDAFVGDENHLHLRGNPAAVVPLEAWPDDSWLQQIAAEFNLSETAFVVPTGANQWDLRWFTPACEVDLCGHATLATGAVLYRERANAEKLSFSTRSGVLTVAADKIDPEKHWLDFPIQDTVPCDLPSELQSALGLKEVVACSKANEDWLLEVPGKEAVEQLKPDFMRLKNLSTQLKLRGAIVTAPSGEPHIDFVSRFFAPGVGVDEDPVTGSAHTKLAPYWGRKLGKTDLSALQLSARGGLVAMSWRQERVLLGGYARLRMRGEILV